MKKLMLVTALATVCLSSLALSPAAATQEPPKAKQQKERLVCEGGLTGTRIRTQRVCMTADQWRIDRDRARADLTAGREQQNVVRYGPGGRQTCASSISC